LDDEDSYLSHHHESESKFFGQKSFRLYFQHAVILLQRFQKCPLAISGLAGPRFDPAMNHGDKLG
jgi:hypothetical protein